MSTDPRLARFLAGLALDPEKLARFLDDPDSAMEEAGVAEEDRRMLRTGDARRLLDPPAAQAPSAAAGPPPEPGEPTGPASLTVVGTGIRGAGQFTVEAIAHLRRAERVHYLVAEPVAEAAILGLQPRARSLADLYTEGGARRRTYRAMVERIVGSVRGGWRTCAVFYGHPGVFVDPSHAAVRAVREQGLPATMLPGVSAEDCLFADLGFDPAAAGCQTYEATDFLVNRRRPDPSCHLVVWQVGVLGDRTFRLSVAQKGGFELLVQRLAEHYPQEHSVCVYEAAVLPGIAARADWIELRRLARDRLSIISTLYVPPAEPPRFDPACYFSLSSPD